MPAHTAFLVSVPLGPRMCRSLPPQRCAPRRPAVGARVDGAGAEYIRLESFLKLQGAADTGGQAKLLVASGMVRVNGEVDRRRGRKLRHGDMVEYDGVSLPVEFSADDEGELEPA